MLRWLTAGESHGPGLTAVLEGMPAGVPVSQGELEADLSRRRCCYGRGGRSSIERDEVRVTGGVLRGLTTGAPISVFIPNRDHENWVGRHIPITAPRPGHADLPGALKYGFTDCRPIAERASARETAARVALGYFARKLLRARGIEVLSWVVSIGDIEAALPPVESRMGDPSTAIALARAADASEVRCPDLEASARMMRAIDCARDAGDTLGGVFEAAAVNVPAGLGSHVHADRRLDARLAGAILSVNGIKGVEFGEGFAIARLPGSLAMDPIEPAMGSASRSVRRPSNRSGGIEGGITNGEPLFIRAAVKPVPTLQRPLPSINLVTGEPCPAHVERSDTCVVASAAVVAEAMIALVLADALLERTGADVLATDDSPAPHRGVLLSRGDSP